MCRARGAISGIRRGTPLAGMLVTMECCRRWRAAAVPCAGRLVLFAMLQSLRPSRRRHRWPLPRRTQVKAGSSPRNSRPLHQLEDGTDLRLVGLVLARGRLTTLKTSKVHDDTEETQFVLDSKTIGQVHLCLNQYQHLSTKRRGGREGTFFKCYF